MTTLAPLPTSSTHSDFFLGHYRSQSDSTNYKSSNYNDMVQPRLLTEAAVVSHISASSDSSDSSNSISSVSRKRNFDDVTQEIFQASSSSPSTKKARSAPSSPINYGASEKSSSTNSSSIQLPPLTPTATPVKLPELPLTPPASNSITSPELYKIEPTVAHSPLGSPRTHSITPTPPSSNSTSPRQFSRVLQSTYKPTIVIPESSFYYPDTCYNFSLVHVSGGSNVSSERSSLLDQQNDEWRDHYSYQVKHQNHQLFKQYKEYCSGIKSSIFSSSASSKVRKPPVLRPSRPSSKLTGFIEHQLKEYNGLVNYPYAANYSYQTTGYLKDIDALTTKPELYNYLSEKTRPVQQQYKPESFKLPPCPKPEELDQISFKHPSVYQTPQPQEIKQQQSPPQQQQQQQPLAPQQSSQLPQLQQHHQPILPPITIHSSSLPIHPHTYQNLPSLQPMQPLPLQFQQPELVSRNEQFKTPPQAPPVRLVTPVTSPRLNISSFSSRIIHTSPNKKSSRSPSPSKDSATPSPQKSPKSPKFPKSPKNPKSPNYGSSSLESHHHHHSAPRTCISCHSSQSPCWRPSWSLTEGQLCNSCGLRYKKTKARCLNSDCLRIPAKGEWTLMQNKGKVFIEKSGRMSYKCLHCDGEVAVDES